jgi:mono/diheme cytochrome c family protein
MRRRRTIRCPRTVLAVILFIGFWALLGFGVFFVAIRGGVGGARAALHTRSSSGLGVLRLLFVVTYVGFGVGLPVALLTGNHANASAQVGGLTLTKDEKTGRALFGEHCAVCHTLSAANAIGKVGPNLDQLEPPQSLVLNTINNGCLQNAPSTSHEQCLGNGTMPAQIIQGRQAQQVAEFVARVAGKE